MNNRATYKVADVMERSPIIIDGLATVSDAMETMRQNGVDYLVINKRDEHDEYGLVAVHDIAEQVIARNRASDRVSVYEIMTKPVIAVDRRMAVKYAIRLLSRFRIARALVLEGGKLAGIVTLRDMALRKFDTPGG